MARDLTDCPRGQTVSAFGSVPDDTVVASIDTYLKYSEAVGITAPVSRPRELVADTESELERVMKENAELRRRLEAAT